MTRYDGSIPNSASAAATAMAPSGSSGPFARAGTQAAIKLNPRADTVCLPGDAPSVHNPITLTAADRGSSFLAMPGEATR